MKIFEPKLDILPACQRDLWPMLRPLRDLGFVLYGGTAIALRLGHRESVDFDFFRHAQLEKQALRASLPALADTSIIQDSPNALTVLTRGNVKLSFFGGIEFGRYGEPEETSDGVLQVAAMDDLLATKLKTILQRAESRDYLDIAAMLETGVSLEKGLAIARAMFAPEFSPVPALKALGYFADGDLPTLPLACRDVLVEAASGVSSLPEVERLSETLDW